MIDAVMAMLSMFALGLATGMLYRDWQANRARLRAARLEAELVAVEYAAQQSVSPLPVPLVPSAMKGNK